MGVDLGGKKKFKKWVISLLCGGERGKKGFCKCDPL